MITYVLDTSVVLKWYDTDNEESVEHALAILNDLRSGLITVIVPNLLLVELLNIFIKGKHLSVDDTQILITSFLSLPLISQEPMAAVVSRVPEISQTYDLTSYDSLFLATAYEADCQLISDDHKGHGKVTDGTVLMLENYRPQTYDESR